MAHANIRHKQNTCATFCGRIGAAGMQVHTHTVICQYIAEHGVRGGPGGDTRIQLTDKTDE